MADLAEVAELHAGGKGIAGAPVALLVVDDDCRVEEANLSACRLLGLGRDEVQGRQLRELLRSQRRAIALTASGAPSTRPAAMPGPFELAWPDAADAGRHQRHRRGPARVCTSSCSRRAARRRPPRPRPRARPPAPVAGAAEARPSRGPTTRERQILGMLASGDTDTQIAGKLALSPATVQTHVRNAKAKLGARTRAQAVAMAIRRGLITSE